MWLKQSWPFKGFTARMFKWSTYFNPDIESPVVPLWINFPLLPLHCFNKKVLYTLASVVGKPMNTDMATAAALQTIRPSVARVCVEANITKVFSERVWISNGGKGMWQTIQVEDKPKYCSNCHKISHLPLDCKNDIDQIEGTSRQKRVWIQKESGPSAQAPHKLSNTNDKRKAVMVPRTSCSENGPSNSLIRPNTKSGSEMLNCYDKGSEMAEIRSQVIDPIPGTVHQETAKVTESHPSSEGNNETNLREKTNRELELTRPDQIDEVRQLPTHDDNNLAQFLALVDGHEVTPVDPPTSFECHKSDGELGGRGALKN